MVNFILIYSNGDAGYTLSQWKWMSITDSRAHIRWVSNLCWSNQQDAQKVAISCVTECNAVFNLDRCTWFRWSTGAQDKWCAYELDYLRLKLSRGRVLTNRYKNMIWLKSHVFVSCSMEMLDWNSLLNNGYFSSWHFNMDVLGSATMYLVEDCQIWNFTMNAWKAWKVLSWEWRNGRLEPKSAHFTGYVITPRLIFELNTRLISLRTKKVDKLITSAYLILHTVCSKTLRTWNDGSKEVI